MTKRIVALVVAIALMALAVPTEAGHRWRQRPTELDIAMANVRQTFNTPLGYLYSGLSYDRYNPYSSWGNDPYWGRHHNNFRLEDVVLPVGVGVMGYALGRATGNNNRASDDPEKCLKKVGKTTKVAEKYGLQVNPDQLMAQCLGEPIVMAAQAVAVPQEPTTITAINATGGIIVLKSGEHVLPNETIVVNNRTEMRSDKCPLAYKPITPGARALVCR